MSEEDKLKLADALRRQRLKRGNRKDGVILVTEFERAAISQERQRLREIVEERRKEKFAISTNEHRFDCLRDIAHGNVEACDWFLTLLAEQPTTK